jgi:hypothetical protein
VAAYVLADHIDVAVLIPFAAGNLIDIALADPVPELITAPTAHDSRVSLCLADRGERGDGFSGALVMRVGRQAGTPTPSKSTVVTTA